MDQRRGGRPPPGGGPPPPAPRFDEAVQYDLKGGTAPLAFALYQRAADAAAKDIIDGKIQVHDYMSDSSCPS